MGALVLKSRVPCGGTWLLLGAGALFFLLGCGGGTVSSLAPPIILQTEPTLWMQTENLYAVTWPDGKVNLWVGVKSACTSPSYPYPSSTYRYAVVLTGTLDALSVADTSTTGCVLTTATATLTSEADSLLRGRMVANLTTPTCGTRSDTIYLALTKVGPLQGGTP